MMNRETRLNNHIQTLQKMREVMLNDEKWESLKPEIEAVTAGGMAIMRVLDEPGTGEWIEELDKTSYNFPFTKMLVCSKCGAKSDIRSRYCPTCGQKKIRKGET